MCITGSRLSSRVDLFVVLFVVVCDVVFLPRRVFVLRFVFLCFSFLCLRVSVFLFCVAFSVSVLCVSCL